MANSAVATPIREGTISAAERDVVVSLGNFIVGPENRMVETAVSSVVAGAPNGYNPLVIHGPSGTGKSHVVASLAATCRTARQRQRVVQTSAADFARELAEAVDTQAIDEFRSRHRGADLLIVEDLDRLIARRSEKLNTQEELNNTLDVMLAERRWLVFTTSAPPTDIQGILPRLQSRLTGGLCIPLSPPGPEARFAILRQFAESRDIALPNPAARALADRIDGAAPMLAKAVCELDVVARQTGRKIDIEVVNKYLNRRNKENRLELHDIARATALHFRVKMSDMRGPKRRRALVIARGVAMYCARQLIKTSYDEIGRYFGGRDHTTVLHACRKTEKAVGVEPMIREALERVKKSVCKK